MTATKANNKMGLLDLSVVIPIAIIGSIIAGVGMGMYNSYIKAVKINGSTAEIPQEIGPLLMAGSSIVFIAFIFFWTRNMMLLTHKNLAPYFVVGFFTFFLFVPIVYTISDAIAMEA